MVLLDYGAKANIARELNKRGCNVAVMPYDTKAEDILALHPDGIMLSNGPGDPAENTAAIAQLKNSSARRLFLAFAWDTNCWRWLWAARRKS